MCTKLTMNKSKLDQLCSAAADEVGIESTRQASSTTTGNLCMKLDFHQLIGLEYSIDTQSNAPKNSSVFAALFHKSFHI
ncbi:hypothetical protein RclHR1_10100005 [Rhizophagus clarus]|uniref:Uncharacterized protein n=1 Tax=Rhizophagus clarus TaxID=94130 RepID=A0A2Z6QRG2_9GLOM|nr:hypothetical protein RclHR1_10100005 [Rhizophagus clarus]